MYIERLFAPHWGWIGALFYAQTHGQIQRDWRCLFEQACLYRRQAERLSLLLLLDEWQKRAAAWVEIICYYLISCRNPSRNRWLSLMGEITRALVGVRRRLCVKWGFVDMDVYEQEYCRSRVSFDYFYGQQSDLFTFYRVPKVLFTNERFWNISADAKMLYGILLDRMSLSAKNGWIDKTVECISFLQSTKRRWL